MALIPTSSSMATGLMALLFAAVHLPTVGAQSFSYSFYYTFSAFDTPTAEPTMATPISSPTVFPGDPTALPIPAPTISFMPTTNAPTLITTVRLSTTMAVSGFACSEYGADEEELFETALEALFVDQRAARAEANGCTDARRLAAETDAALHRQLSDQVSLAFDIELMVSSSSGSASQWGTTITDTISNGTAFADALAAANYSGSLTIAEITVTGVTTSTQTPTANPTPSPTPSPNPVAPSPATSTSNDDASTPAPTPTPTAAPQTNTITKTSGACRRAPSIGAVGVCLAVLAAAMV